MGFPHLLRPPEHSLRLWLHIIFRRKLHVVLRRFFVDSCVFNGKLGAAVFPNPPSEKSEKITVDRDRRAALACQFSMLRLQPFSRYSTGKTDFFGNWGCPCSLTLHVKNLKRILKVDIDEMLHTAKFKCWRYNRSRDIR